MKVSIKTPTLDLEVDDVKNLDDVLEFVAGLRKLEREAESAQAKLHMETVKKMGGKKPPKKK